MDKLKNICLLALFCFFTLNLSAQTDSLIISQVISPPDTCVKSISVHPSLIIKNIGTDTVSNVQISFAVDGAYPLSATYNNPIAPNDSIVYTFSYYFIAPSYDFDICLFIQYANKRDSVCKRIIIKLPDNDVGICSLVIPNQIVFLGTNIYPQMWIKNYGLLSQDTIPVEYSIGGVNYTQEVYYGLINPGDSVLYTFNTPYTFVNTSTGWITFYVQTALSGDFSTCNNSIALSYFTSIKENQNAVFQLYQNFPNPSISSTNISFLSKINSYVDFIVRDINGKLIYQSKEIATVGENIIVFNTENILSGTYFYSLIVDNIVQTKSLQIHN